MMQRLTADQVWRKLRKDICEHGDYFYYYDEKSGLNMHFKKDLLMLNPGHFVTPLWMSNMTNGESAGLLAIAERPSVLRYRLGYYQIIDRQPSFVALPFDEDIEREPDLLIEIDWNVVEGTTETEHLAFIDVENTLDEIYSHAYAKDVYRHEGEAFFVLRNQCELKHDGIEKLLQMRQKHIERLRQISDQNFQEFSAHRDEYQRKFHELVEPLIELRSWEVEIDDEAGFVELKYEGSPAAKTVRKAYFERLQYEACAAWVNDITLPKRRDEK